MTDQELVDLYLNRAEDAIAQTARQYGPYCHTIAYNILFSHEDADESVNDTWFAAWNTIPPQKPTILKAYLGKITRHLALKRYRDAHRLKRGDGEVPLALDELGECISGGGDPESAVMAQELGEALRHFVANLPETERNIFLCRYWYLDSVEQIGRNFGFSISKTKSMLHRIRLRLRKHLEQEGLL